MSDTTWSRSPEEACFDAFLAAMAAGETPDITAFVSDFDVPDPTDLRLRLEAIRVAATVATIGDEETRDESERGPLRPGLQIGPYQLVSEIGSGGMGVVWRATDLHLDRSVAIKFLRPELARSATAMERFEREAHAVARLTHPNVIAVHAAGRSRGSAWLAMAYAPGEGLDDTLEAAGGPLPPADVARLGLGLARGLHAAHVAGIVHRDVKPSNVRITPDGRPLLLDFGIARDIQGSSVTLTDAFVGSPTYSAPEQIDRGGGNIGPHTDIYALGVVLYECLTGVSPFEADGIERVMHRILDEVPPAPRTVIRTTPRDLSTVVMEAIEKRPVDRYPTAAAFAEDLAAVLELRPIAARAPGIGRRLQRAARQRPVLSGSIFGACIVAVLAAVWSWQQARIGHAATRRAQETTLTNASIAAETLRTRATEERTLEQEYLTLRNAQKSGWLTPEQDERLAALETEIRVSRRERERIFYATMESLQRLQAAGVEQPRVDRVRGELFFSRYEEADARGDSFARETWRDLVIGHDSDGTLSARLVDRIPLKIVCDPPDARVHVYRFVEQSDVVAGGQRRRVPVPAFGPAPAWAGAWNVRIIGVGDNAGKRGAPNDPAAIQVDDVLTELAGEPVRGRVFVVADADAVEESDASPGLSMRIGDVVERIDETPISEMWQVRAELKSLEAAATFSVHLRRGQERWTESIAMTQAVQQRFGDARALAEAGGVSATVLRGNDVKSRVTLPAGLSARVDAIPMPLIETAEAAPSGDTANTVMLERGAFVITASAPGHVTTRYLADANALDAGEVRIRLLPESEAIPGWIAVLERDGDTYQMMEREVIASEYRDFLNSIDTDEFDAATRAPRRGDEQYWERDASGTWLVPDDWEEAWPILSISHEDAVAYAAWMTTRLRDRGVIGTREACTLPTLEEWVQASGGTTRWIFGDVFNPKWTNSVFARPTAHVRRVMQFPVDVSWCGAYDVAGCVSEWLDHWWRESQGERHHAGGSWAHGDPEMFAIHGGHGLEADRTAGWVGFRLVLRRAPASDGAPSS